MAETIQEYFDRYMAPITGGTVDVETSSHGRAFMEGWACALENAIKWFDTIDERSANVLRQMYEEFSNYNKL